MTWVGAQGWVRWAALCWCCARVHAWATPGRAAPRCASSPRCAALSCAAELFYRLDEDGTGTINAAQLKEALAHMGKTVGLCFVGGGVGCGDEWVGAYLGWVGGGEGASCELRQRCRF